jgi:hypothetical protein
MAFIKSPSSDRLHQEERTARMRASMMTTVAHETKARRSSGCDRWRAGKACTWFLTKPSAISSKRPPVQEFFAYPQEVWISLWMIGPNALSGAHR